MNRFANGSVAKVRDSIEAKKKLDILLGVARQEYAEKKFADTLRTCDLMLELDPENFFALRYAARIHTQMGDIERAEAIWRRLCTTPRNKYEPAMNVARFAERREQWDTMAEFADLALREEPERLEPLRMAIRARVGSRRFGDLFELLPRLHLIDPERALGFMRDLDGPEQLPVLAAAFMRNAEATRSNEAVTASRGQSPTVWLAGARQAMSGRQDNLAECYLRTALAIEPSSREAIDGLAVLSRESLIELRKAIKKSDRLAAIYHAEIATDINPALVEAWFARARLTEVDDPDRAADFFRICARLDPRDAHYQVRLGRSLRKARKLDEALSAYEQAGAIVAADSDRQSIEVAFAIAELRPLVFGRARELLNEGRIKEAWAHFYAATGGSRLSAAVCLTQAFPRSMIETLFSRFRQ